jgi:enolase-phosphatase E1
LPDPGSPIRAVVLDVEGTTTPIAFVRDVLFPFARARLPDLLRTRPDDPAVAAELDAVRQAAPGVDPLAVLLGWMDADAKQTPLKALQGLLWREGYESGALHGAMYPDVAPSLRRWHAAGLRLFVYSSGSTEAQRLIFGHSTAGDLTGLLSGYFDTRVGAKREAGSYRAIAESIGMAPGALLFLSDVEAELDAAETAGFATCQLVRTADGTAASARHPGAASFPEVATRFGMTG